jgi:hypothetical protein
MSRLRLTKIGTPTAPAATTAEIFYSTPDSKLEAIDESGNIAVLGGFATKDFRLIRVYNITSGTTYTPSTGTRALYVECVGGGGAGGGAAVSSASISTGGGGGSGAYSAVFLTGTIKPSYVVAIGAAGISVNGAAGNPGGDTTFDSPSVCTAKGGGGGGTLATGTSTTGVNGGAGGAASSGVGDLKLDGSDGGAGIRLGATGAITGAGGNAPIGGGTANSTIYQGNTGKLYGGGGSGAATSGAAAWGGSGAAGVIRVWEFA